MRTHSAWYAGVVALSLTMFSAPGMSAGQVTADEVRIDDDDIGGTVRGPNGPEAGERSQNTAVQRS